MNAILSRVFWAKTQVFWDSSVSWVFYLRFSLLQIAIHEETQVDLSLSVSRIFFVRIFKTRVESGFLSGFALFVLFLLYPDTAAYYEYFINPYTVHTLRLPSTCPCGLSAQWSAVPSCSVRPYLTSRLPLQPPSLAATTVGSGGIRGTVKIWHS
jgi:hypothetical protein